MAWTDNLDPKIVAGLQAGGAKGIDREGDLVLSGDDTHPLYFNTQW